MNFDKFQNPRYALLLIQMQLLISVFIELISMAALNSYDSVGAVVANFLAMTVLRSFDDVFLVQFMNPKMKQFQELEIPRYKFKAEKIVIEDEFDVAHEVYTEKFEMIKKHVEVVEPAADENDESQRGEDEGKVAPAPEAEAKTVKLTWKGDVAFADQRQAYKDLGLYVPKKGWFQDTDLDWWMFWQRNGYIMLRLYEFEMIIYESFFFTVVPLLGVLIYFGNLIFEDIFGY